MNKKQLMIAWVVLATFLSGCVTVSVIKYPEASYEMTQQFFEDLESGRLKIGTSLRDIRLTYGDPESIISFTKKTLILYKRPNRFDSAYLWFDENEQLESWSR
ncbi:MAG: hypothetical protein NG712_02220 [Omnitrophica bacterium]|nr:hypothetical protein [Candidatus Omnitrophota bacterium]